MQYDNPETEWTPARQGWGRRSAVVVGALVIMAASCVAAGFVIGRMTSGPMAGNATAHLGPVGSGEVPAAALAVTPGLPFKKQPERDTALASGGTEPSLVILNPGTADGKQEEPDSARSSRFRDASKLRSDVRNPEPRDNRSLAVTDRVSGGDRRDAGSSTERDYRALRDYMLTR